MASSFPDALRLKSFEGAHGVVKLPGSKSISNRALLLSALALGKTELIELLDADDVRFLMSALTTLGVTIEKRDAQHALVHGVAGNFPQKSATLFLGNAGTAVRPLTAVLSLLGGDYTLDGVPRMRERPIRDLVDALYRLSCQVRYLGNEGYLPLWIGERNPDAPVPHEIQIRGDVSSQFLSALLMALPLLPNPHAASHTQVRLTTPLISRPYVNITTHLMARFSVEVKTPDDHTFLVPRGVCYQSPQRFWVESDASSASYFLAAGAIGGGAVRVLGVGKHSIQGDIAFARVLEDQGAIIRWGDNYIEAASHQNAAGKVVFKGGEIDCLNIPDAAMTLAITALSAATPTTLLNIGSWRVKETDRIAAVATELRKVGARVETTSDSLTVYPTSALHHAAIDTYEDHRMAMCFSLLSLMGTDITINHPSCVAKTFPTYFDLFQSIGGGKK
ncbi:MAG: 3-phosphoshikimate 1-carboxyvinyltransferase [Burkholderiales bacterium]|jgi:3-phosphoshikimate 1-carboxyvinyltransferase|nr:3-phosphoshikimate 1-carboxyvinyltransferase [Burkholderiales bacterium]